MKSTAILFAIFVVSIFQHDVSYEKKIINRVMIEQISIDTATPINEAYYDSLIELNRKVLKDIENNIGYSYNLDKIIDTLE